MQQPIAFSRFIGVHAWLSPMKLAITARSARVHLSSVDMDKGINNTPKAFYGLGVYRGGRVYISSIRTILTVNIRPENIMLSSSLISTAVSGFILISFTYVPNFDFVSIR